LRQCKTLFGGALEDEVIPFNPFRGKGLPSPKCVPSLWYYLKPGEYLKLLAVTDSIDEKVLYALCFTAGLRETEALTLRWIDVDFEKSRIHVVNQKATEKFPPFDIKDSDARTVPVPKHTLDLLTKLQVESPEGSPYILITGDRFRKVCEKWQRLRGAGKPWLPRWWANNVMQKFHRRVKKAGIDTAGKELTVHVLRKCCIQNWRNNLPENVVKAWGGHSSIETTDRFYSTVDEMHFDAAIKFGDGLLATDLKLTFSTVSEENQRV
jgi:integrase